MLCFLPPVPGAPRPAAPGPSGGTAVGVVLAIVLTVAGLVLPWLRPAVWRAPEGTPHARPAIELQR